MSNENQYERSIVAITWHVSKVGTFSAHLLDLPPGPRLESRGAAASVSKARQGVDGSRFESERSYKERTESHSQCARWPMPISLCTESELAQLRSCCMQPCWLALAEAPYRARKSRQCRRLPRHTPDAHTIIDYTSHTTCPIARPSRSYYRRRGARA